MGQIPNKTYTAPDGSVYRVEADGSVTKIKGGRVQSNEPPSKYKITPDGKIYRVEDDGSVTYLGNAEERSTAQPSYPNIHQEPKKRSHAWVWVILVLVAIGVVGAIAISNINDYESPSQSDDWSNYESQSEQTEYTEQATTERYYFPETAIYYGHEGDPEDGENVKMFFWSDGTCKILEDNICESSECGGSYYIENDVIHVTWGDNTNETFDISNGSFSRYGVTISRIYE